MFLRTTSTTRSLTVIWCFSVLILILHELENFICLGVILQDFADRIENFPLLELVATPTILLRFLDFSIQGDGELFIISKIIVQRPPGTSIQQFWIGCPAGRILHLPGKVNDSRQVLLVFLCLALALRDQGIEQF